MRTFRVQTFVASFLCALVGIASFVWGTAPSSASTPESLQIFKECSQFTGHVGDHCTITYSSLEAIPPLTKVFYFGPVLPASTPYNPNRISSAVVLETPGGDTATGHCTLSQKTLLGTCTFEGGTGVLTGFHAIVSVSVESTGLFHWD